MLGLPLAMLVKTSLLAKFAKHLDHPIERTTTRNVSDYLTLPSAKLMTALLNDSRD